MVQYKTLDDIEKEVMHEAFLEAFSDYEVDMDIPFSHFKRELVIRGFVPEVSIGAFYEDELVGFVINGVRDWYGTRTAYDIFTGVVPDRRRQGISTNIFKELKEMLRENDIEEYLLEVIKTNEGAVKLYKKKGFDVSRGFKCYRNYDPGELKTYNVDENLSIKNIDDIDFKDIQKLLDFKPSWQNSIDAIRSSPDIYKAVIYKEEGNIQAYGIMDIKVGNLIQIGISEEYKSKKLLGKMIRSLVDDHDFDRLSAINIEEDSEFLNDVLPDLGFELVNEQFEMSIEI